MIEFLQILNELNAGFWAEMVFTRKLLYDVSSKKRPIINGIGVVNRIEIPIGGKNVLLYLRGGKEDGSDYIRTKGVDDIIRVADQSSKSDVIINGRGCSIKAFTGSAPSIASRMNRKNFQNLLAKVGISDIQDFIKAVDNHHEECVIGNLKCTLKISDPPYNVLPKEEWTKLINYLSFEGSATRKSRNPAEFVIEIAKNGKTFKILSKEEFINSALDRIILWVEKRNPDDEDRTSWSLNIRIKEK